MAKLNVQATFTLDTSSYPRAPLWLALSVSTSDGLPVILEFPNPAYPGRTWPVKAIVLTSEHLGGVPVKCEVTDVIYDSPFEYPGIYNLDFNTADPDITTPLAQVRPLAIGVIVESGADRGQALALASPSMEPDTTQP
jgi:hypothetical protein